MADAYRHRPPYPPAVFAILLGLLDTRPRRILDAGCGTGNLARSLAASVDHVDAVDCSRAMIARGRRLPEGDHPHLRWIWGRVEEVALASSYGLVGAGESLHWMDWEVVLPRLRRLLVPGGYLAIVVHDTIPDAWSMLGDIVARYRDDGGHEPFDLIGQLGQRGLFEIVGERTIGPVPFLQSVDDLVESYHSRSGFTRARLGAARAAAFDAEARELLRSSYGDEVLGEGMLALQVTGHVVWGFPGG